MPPTADLSLQSQSSHHTTSSDVFGDVLEDVDVWAEFGTAHPPSHEGVHEVVQEAITIAERIPSSPVVSKPPRTPHSRRRMMQAELLLSHPNSGRLLRRSSVSETDLTQNSAQKHALEPSSLPPMTPRTRIRKIGLLAALPGVPSLSEPPPPPPPPPRQLSVAEKRRKRNENISSRAFGCQFEEDDNTFPAFESDNNGSVDDTYPVDWKQQLGLFIQSRKSDIQAPHDRPVRRYSDGGMVFKVNDMFSEGGSSDVSDPNEISFDPVRPETDEAPDKPNEHRRRHRESRSEYLDDRRRSSSNSAKNNRARRRGSMSAHQHSSTAETSSPRTKRSQDEEGKPPRRGSRSAHPPCPASSSSSKTQRSREEDEDTDNLLSHLKHNSENEEESPRSVDMRSSFKTTLATPQGRPVQAHQKSDSSELSHESPKSRRDQSTSKRRESRRSSFAGNDPPPRESSVPRAGAKIKFVKRNSTNDDGTDAKSTRADNKSTKSSKSSKSAKSSRSGCVKSSRRPSLGSCPPSPSPKSEKPTRSRSDDCPESPIVRRRSEIAERRRRSDAKEMTPKVTGTPRRKIKFVRRGSNVEEETGHPPIPNLWV